MLLRHRISSKPCDGSSILKATSAAVAGVMGIPGAVHETVHDGSSDDADSAIQAGMALLQNDLSAAIQVETGKEVATLYPGRSRKIQITADKLIRVSLRDDPTISAACQMVDSISKLSDSFGSFPEAVADFADKEQKEVEREQRQLRNRKMRIERHLADQQKQNVFLGFAILFICSSLFFLND